MHFTRPRDLLVAGLIGLALGFALFQFAYGSMPALPLLAGLPMAILAVVELILGITVRNRIRTGRVLNGIAVARAVALAKASSLLGSLMAGAWIAALAYLVPRGGDITAAADDTPSAAVGVLCSGALIAAALWLEHCCRAPEPQDSDRRPRTTG